MPIEVLKKELEGFDTSKGTVRFPADRPLAVALVRKLVRARIAEQGARRASDRGSGERRPAPR